MDKNTRDMSVYTRSEWELVLKGIDLKIADINDTLVRSLEHKNDEGSPLFSEHVADVLRNEVKRLVSTKSYIQKYIETQLVGSCLLCRTQMDLDVPSITFICRKCDDNLTIASRGNGK